MLVSATSGAKVRPRIIRICVNISAATLSSLLRCHAFRMIRQRRARFIFEWHHRSFIERRDVMFQTDVTRTDALKGSALFMAHGTGQWLLA